MGTRSQPMPAERQRGSELAADAIADVQVEDHSPPVADAGATEASGTVAAGFPRTIEPVGRREGKYDGRNTEAVSQRSRERSFSDERNADQPTLFIGNIDVIVEAPPPAEPSRKHETSGSDLTSRYYLRRL